jgi:competence ComEA-like helix-hairpin-helix protein
VNATAAETRAIAFVGFLILAVLGARWLDRPRTVFDGADGVDLAALEAASRDALAAVAARGRGLAPDERMDPNRAEPAELARLPRVGPALAARIVEERERAPFATAWELTRVPGIGPAMIEAIAPHLDLPAGEPPQARPRTTPPPIVPAPPASTAPRATATAGDGLVDINRAGPDELERLPGIGPAIARRIVAHRDSAGPFHTAEDLLAVRGIGPATLARLLPYLRHVP